MLSQTRIFLLILALAFSFGGFTFYSAAVIPIGSDVLDKTTQGFVTQRVTHVINAASLVSLLLFAWQGFVVRRQLSKFSVRCMILLLCIYSCSLISLVVIHPYMDGLLDFDDLSVKDPDTFYQMHRAYLWISTLQWLTTIALIWLVICSPSSRFESPS